jgi:hypothetical protein
MKNGHSSIIILSFLFSVMLSGIAYAANNTVDIFDKNNPVDYQKLNSFTEQQDGTKTTYVAKQGGDLIISDKPIPVRPAINTAQQIIKTAQAAITPNYAPSTFADLGMQMDSRFNSNVMKASSMSLASNELYELPVIPTYTPAENVVTVVTQNGPVHYTSRAPEEPTYLSPSQAVDVIKGASILFLLSMLGATLFIWRNVFKHAQPIDVNDYSNESSYVGAVGEPTEMVGKGDIFNFNLRPENRLVMPLNTNNLNILCNMGKFSQDGAVNTYFYIAYYIPSQHAYAAVLQKKKVDERESVVE